jgi:hypothetical protein
MSTGRGNCEPKSQVEQIFLEQLALTDRHSVGSRDDRDWILIDEVEQIIRRLVPAENCDPLRVGRNDASSLGSLDGTAPVGEAATPAIL